MLGDLLEILKVNFVKKFDDEDDMSADNLLNSRFLELAGLKNFGLVEGSALGNFVPNLLDVGFLFLIQAFQKIIIEFFVIDEFGNDESNILLNNFFRLEFRASNFLRDIS